MKPTIESRISLSAKAANAIIRPRSSKSQEFGAQASHSLESMPYGLYALCLLGLCILPFSPLVGFILGFLLLFMFGFGLDDRARILLGVSIILSGSIVYASRVYFHWEGDDFIRYYAGYTRLLEGDLRHLLMYQIEVGLPIFYMSLITVFGHLSPEGVLFWSIIFASALFYIWLEKFAMKGLNNREKALCVFFSLLFFEFYIASQYSRQFFSSLFILYALSVRSIKWKVLFSLLPACFTPVRFCCLFHYLR